LNQRLNNFAKSLTDASLLAGAVQVIWHRNRGQNSPLIELLEHSTAYIPRLSIGED